MDSKELMDKQFSGRRKTECKIDFVATAKAAGGDKFKERLLLEN